ncbi:hypothetical protein BKA70DRAFT_1215060 [Coprinopsis sp. MPI-PUGE-AT-0042]|nr:hypothetical protein BKA70DRAFT_1215060 [Coprinopsis sp. MPI-PUGE-AT-0042]
MDNDGLDRTAEVRLFGANEPLSSFNHIDKGANFDLLSIDFSKIDINLPLNGGSEKDSTMEVLSKQKRASAHLSQAASGTERAHAQDLFADILEQYYGQQTRTGIPGALDDDLTKTIDAISLLLLDCTFQELQIGTALIEPLVGRDDIAIAWPPRAVATFAFTMRGHLDVVKAHNRTMFEDVGPLLVSRLQGVWEYKCGTPLAKYLRNFIPDKKQFPDSMLIQATRLMFYSTSDGTGFRDSVGVVEALGQFQMPAEGIANGVRGEISRMIAKGDLRELDEVLANNEDIKGTGITEITAQPGVIQEVAVAVERRNSTSASSVQKPTAQSFGQAMSDLTRRLREGDHVRTYENLHPANSQGQPPPNGMASFSQGPQFPAFPPLESYGPFGAWAPSISAPLPLTVPPQPAQVISSADPPERRVASAPPIGKPTQEVHVPKKVRMGKGGKEDFQWWTIRTATSEPVNSLRLATDPRPGDILTHHVGVPDGPTNTSNYMFRDQWVDITDDYANNRGARLLHPYYKGGRILTWRNAESREPTYVVRSTFNKKAHDFGVGEALPVEIGVDETQGDD